MNGFLTAAGDNPEVMRLLQLEHCRKHLVSRNSLRPGRPVVHVSKELLPAKSLVHDFSPGAERFSLRNCRAGEKSVRKFDKPTHSRNLRLHQREPSRFRRWPIELTQTGLTWKYYDAPLPKGYTLANGILGCPTCNVYDYWNPLTSSEQDVDRTPSTLTAWSREANFSLISRTERCRMSLGSSLQRRFHDHPPANISLGEWWIADLVNAVMNSQVPGKIRW